MNTRIAQVRKDSGLTQEDFSKKLGLTRNFIWMLEKGDRVPGDRTIVDICREFSVNETWLRTGKGDPYCSLSRNAQLTKFVGEAMRDGAPEDQCRFLNALMGATPEELHAIARFAQRLAAEYEQSED